jgi:hypothetical protein
VQGHFTRPSISSQKIKLHVIHDYSLQVIISRKRTWVTQKKKTCSTKHEEKKRDFWTHEGPSIKKEEIAHVQRKKIERDGS